MKLLSPHSPQLFTYLIWRNSREFRRSFDGAADFRPPCWVSAILRFAGQDGQPGELDYVLPGIPACARAAQNRASCT